MATVYEYVDQTASSYGANTEVPQAPDPRITKITKITIFFVLLPSTVCPVDM